MSDNLTPEAEAAGQEVVENVNEMWASAPVLETDKMMMEEPMTDKLYRIKPLVWEEMGKGWWIARTFYGRYLVSANQWVLCPFSIPDMTVSHIDRGASMCTEDGKDQSEAKHNDLMAQGLEEVDPDVAPGYDEAIKFVQHTENPMEPRYGKSKLQEAIDNVRSSIKKCGGKPCIFAFNPDCGLRNTMEAVSTQAVKGAPTPHTPQEQG